MIKRRALLVIMAGVMLVAALWPGRWLQAAYANITLVSFTATSLPGQPEIYIVWETGTEFDTVGFFIARSDSATGEFTRISDFIQHAGDTVIGAQYGYIDENTVLNQAYYYRLEVLNTDQSVDYHGPIRAVAGVPATETPTVTVTPTPSRTPTRTPTFTPSPTPTLTPSPTPTTSGGSTTSNTTTSNTGAAVVTPRAASGATVTPRATAAGSSTNPVEPTATLPLFAVANETLPSSAIATPDLSGPGVSIVDTAAPLPSIGVDITQEPGPTLAPVAESAAIAAPVVITPAPAPSEAAGPANIAPLLLVAAALLFLGIAFVILRQAGR